MKVQLARGLAVFRTLLLIAALLSVPIVGAPAWAAGERLPVWKVTGQQAEAVLLGSIHMAYPEIYPLRDEILTAFAAADTLVVEVDISGDKSLEVQQMMMEKGMLAPGDSLQQHLSPQTRERLHRYLDSRGLRPAMFNTLHPGLLVTVLSSMRMVELGLRPELGIDQYFLNLARGEKTIVELETAEQQIDLLLSFPDNDLLLAQTLAELEAVELHLDPLYEAWRSGDAVALDSLIATDELRRNPQFRPIYHQMFGQRNLQMAAKIARLLDTSGRYFVVVGAGHLVGESSIISLLKRTGYQVQRF